MFIKKSNLLTKHNRVYRYIYIYILLSLPLSTLIGYYLKNILYYPNIYSISRDVFLFILFALGLFRIGGLKVSRNIPATIVTIFFAAYYITVSLFENKLYEGFFFLRLYVIPIVFFIVTIIMMDQFDDAWKRKLLKYLIIMNIAVNIIAMLLYVEFINNKMFFLRLIGQDRINFGWWPAATRILRLGLPFSNPNDMGMYFAINSYVFILLVKEKIMNTNNFMIHTLIFTNFILLILTFSRSSLIFLVMTLSLIALYKLKVYLVRYLSYIMVAIIILFTSYIIINDISNEALSKWIMLNVTLEDPSIHGHYDSIKDAFLNINKYFATGYPKGTVGTKASQFTINIVNVENSFLIILYDTGIIGFILIMTTYLLLVRREFRHEYQIYFFIAYIFILQLLPYIYEIEILMYSIAIFILLRDFPFIKNAQMNPKST